MKTEQKELNGNKSSTKCLTRIPNASWYAKNVG